MSQHLRISIGNKFEYFSILVFSFFLKVLQCIYSVMEQQVHRKYVLLINENNIFLFIYLFYFWLQWVFVAVHRLSPVAESGSSSLVAVHRHQSFSLRQCLLLWSMGSRACRPQQLQFMGSRVQTKSSVGHGRSRSAAL